MQPYFYVIKHKETGKYYAGSRTAKNSNPSELLKEDGYHTSSIIVKKIITITGLKSFEVVRIKTFNTPNEAYDYETRFLKKVNAANNINFLNLHNNVFTLGEVIDNEFVPFTSKGGKIGGVINAINGHMLRIREMVDEEKRIAKVKKTLSENKTGCFLDEELHKKSASLGGKVQGKRNAESGHLKNIACKYWEDVRSGKIERKKRKWYNNGHEERKIPEGETIPENFVKGRLKK